MRAAAQGGRGERGRRAAGGTEVARAGRLGEHAERGGRRVAADGVEHEVHRAAGGVAASGAPVRRRRRRPGPRRQWRPAAAPARAPRARRLAATTTPAPSATATWTATCPTTPPAPRTSTRSPGAQAAAAVSAIQAATAERPERRGVDVGDPGRQRDQPVGGHHRASVARLPFPGRIPASVVNQTRVPAAGPRRARRTDTLDAGDVRQRAAARSTTSPSRRAGRAARRRRGHPDEHLARPALRQPVRRRLAAARRTR